MCASITCEKNKKKKSEKGSVYTYTPNSGKMAFMCIYTRGKKKREKGKIKSRYICTPKKTGKKKGKPLYICTPNFWKRPLVCIYTGEKKKGKREEKRGGVIYTHQKDEREL